MEARIEEKKFMATAGAAMAAAAIANAIKASGVIVRVNAKDFQTILRKVEKPLVVYAESGFFRKNYNYLVSYRGLAFYTKTNAPLLLPLGTETVTAQKMYIPP